MKQQVVVDPSRRMEQLVAERNRKMAASAHAYVRGSTTRFYEWLGAKHRLALPEGPPIWICGDCHAGNLGPVASTSGALEIQIRDLDQTVIGNPAHDLVRLALSLAMAARGSDLPGVTTAHMVERMMDGYEAAFNGDEEPEATPKTVTQLLRQAAGRSWKHLADERIEGLEPVIPLGERFWPLTEDETAAIAALFETEEVRALATALRSRDDDAEVRVLDAAYWRKGCSSLGRLRFAVLLGIGTGKAERHCLMDIKEAVTAAAPRSEATAMPDDQAVRVVTGARALSPFLGRRMLATELLGKSVFMRELLPQDLKIELEQISREEAIRVAEFLAYVVGRGHARQLGSADRDAWITELQHNRTRSLDAPTWLWTSVVDLVGTHESAYLEHCRRYATTTA